jgi:phytanoyl-CoA hydroxylase
VLLRGLFAREECARWSVRFEALVLGQAERPSSLLVVRDVMVAKGAVAPASPLHAVNKLLHLEDDPVLFAHAADARLVSAASALVGEGLMSIATNLFNKPPGVDGRHPLHQDLLYFPLRPAEKIVGAWTALDAATRENGCLCVIPGSQRGELLAHADPDWEHVNRFFFGARGVDLCARVHVPMEPGDTLLFHPLLLHGSGHNASPGFRRAISAHYARRDCEQRSQDGPLVSRFRPV